jgi:hypothetical protein
LSFGHLEESPGNREEWSISLAERGTWLAFGRWSLAKPRPRISSTDETSGRSSEEMRVL